MNLHRLEFTLTTKCNSQCIHCQADASPLRKEVMDVGDGYNYLTEATAVSDLQSFMVFGGEPMLYPERAIAMFKRACQLRIPKIEMITNGIWGKDKEKAEKLAEKLKTAGLNEVVMSVDAFHAQHIPLEYPKNAALALVKAGIRDVRWNVAVVESIDAENKYDKKTRQILKKLEPTGIDAHIFKIMPVGRAVKNLGEFFKHTSLLGPCEGDPILGNPLTNPDSICIEPSGEVDVCWRLSIGNAKEKPLSRIISEYDWRKIPTVKILVEEGPMGLLKSAEERRYRLRMDQYINKCHLCMKIRDMLNVS
jgi:MoaA/NifB/PqqE/SkfB family radical SAM enzyme